MNDNTKPLVFSVKRNDLLYNFASSFDEMFSFTPFSNDTLNQADGVRFQEGLGFDFQNECSPIIEISPPDQSFLDQLSTDSSDIEVNIALVDIALGIREIVYSMTLDEINETKRKSIDLKVYTHLSFFRGFEVQCAVSRASSDQTPENIVWHKSQTIYNTQFVVKASVEEELFEISWMTFSDDDERKDVLMYVDWRSADVSDSPSVDCFHVIANNELKDQFKRLENNSHFGPLCVRMIAQEILKDIVVNCIANCDLQIESTVGSLHEKVSQLFDRNGFDFVTLARQMQGTNGQEKMAVFSEVSKLMQKLNNSGSTLQKVKFGGYRTL
jgi:hypothetical protein